MGAGILFQAAKADAARFASFGGFAISAILTTPDKSVSTLVSGPGTGTWYSIDDLSSGKSTNSTSNSFTIPEAQLIAAAYPYKNANGRISLMKHTVVLDDGAGLSGSYEIIDQHPNSTLGLIVCILGRVSS